MKVKSKGCSQRGAVMVEAALTMLTLLILLFAILEAGRMLNIQQTLTNAAREGARLSVLPAAASGTPPAPSDTLPTAAQIRTRVRTFLNAAGVNGANVPDGNIVVDQGCCVDPATGNCGSCTTGATVFSRVTVTVPYRILSISMFSMLQVNLQGQATMRNETNLQ
jgi:Flp pilus assembly protein TadG